MISLIICSRTPDIPQTLKDNISETIGVEYELVVIDNSNNNYSIFSAYNEGIKRSRGEILCFMHEDILYRTEGWGKLILHHLDEKNVGFVGFAGTHFFPTVPTYWTSSPFISEYYLTNDNGEIIESKKVEFFNNKNLVDVVACDGFCFFIRKELFSKISFDSVTFSGFHFYDMDICMQVISAGYRVCVARNIQIEHFWTENPNKKGMELFEINQNIFFNKWKSSFPISRGIDHFPQYVLDRTDRLYQQAEDAKKARRSKAYRLGAFLLHPMRYFIKK